MGSTISLGPFRISGDSPFKLQYAGGREPAGVPAAGLLQGGGAAPLRTHCHQAHRQHSTGATGSNKSDITAAATMSVILLKMYSTYVDGSRAFDKILFHEHFAN